MEGIQKDINPWRDKFSIDEECMKRTAGRNTAVTNTMILIFDLAMLFLSAELVGFEGCLINTLALMSSFGPVVALAAGKGMTRITKIRIMVTVTLLMSVGFIMTVMVPLTGIHIHKLASTLFLIKSSFLICHTVIVERM